MLGNDLIEFPEQLHLVGEALDDGLDDQVAVGQLPEVGAEAQLRADAFDILVAQLAPEAAALEGLLHPRASGTERLVSGLGHPRAQTAAGADLGDARAHQPGTDDAHGPDLHGCLQE